MVTKFKVPEGCTVKVGLLPCLYFHLPAFSSPEATTATVVLYILLDSLILCIWKCVCVCVCVCVKVTQSCPTLCDPMDCSLPDFFVHGILQARILE